MVGYAIIVRFQTKRSFLASERLDPVPIVAGLQRTAELRDKERVAESRRRADEIRAIARGIFDKGERQVLLEFVADCEKLFVGNGAGL
jgi:hypothetical protein